MLKRTAVVITLLLSIYLLTSCSIAKNVKELHIDKADLIMEVGTNEGLTLTFTPSDAKSPEIEWLSSDEKIASVDNMGSIQALSIGTVSITAKTSYGKVSTSCNVTVISKHVKELKLVKDSLTIEAGSSEKLEFSIEPVDAGNKKVIWDSTNKQIATVDENGAVTAVAEGNTEIIAKSEDGAITAKLNVTVKVKPQPQPNIIQRPTTPDISSNELTVKYNTDGGTFWSNGKLIGGFFSRTGVNPQPSQFLIQVGTVGDVPETDFRAVIYINGKGYEASGRTNMQDRAFNISNEIRSTRGTFNIDIFVSYKGKDYIFKNTLQNNY